MAQKNPVNDQNAPNLQREEALWKSGHIQVAGIDEAGRGALAGPVVAAALVLPVNTNLAGVWTQVRDSKLLTPKARESLEPAIQAGAQSWATGQATPAEIDRLGIAPATRLAMSRAIDSLACKPDHLLIDWVKLDEVDIPQTSWPKADRYCVSVAAASILAKVHRDRILCDLGREYPDYGLEKHKGYGTEAHRSALAKVGPCPEHRFTFRPVAEVRTPCRESSDYGTGRPNG